MADIFDNQFEGKDIELDDNKAVIGDDINITAKDPALKHVKVGMGWDLNAFDADTLDLDLSIFLLDKNGMTQFDEDFIFYNNMEGSNGAVKHHHDSRTGAGDGDDETASIDLEGVSYDVHKILFVLSIYKGNEKDQTLDMVRGAFLRLVNDETNFELVRYVLDKDLDGHQETAMLVASLNREGPKWHFTPIGEFVENGLSEVAKRYGLIIIDQ